MIAYITIDMKAIEKLRSVPEEKERKDMLPDTLAALRKAGFKPKKHQGRLFQLWSMIRGEVEGDEKIADLRKIAFVVKARIAGKGRYPSDRK